MTLLTRRSFLKGVAGGLIGSAALGTYAFAVEPMMVLDITRYNIAPASWPADMTLRIAVIADIHACEPYMSAARIRRICTLVNSLEADLIVLLGDFNGGHVFVTRPVMPEEWAEAISVLEAPLGRFAILGNHDWWHGVLPNVRGDRGDSVRKGLQDARVTLLENNAVRLVHRGKPFWLLGLADQLAYFVSRGHWRGADDLDATLAQVNDAAPIVLLAHEPLIFPRVPERVAVTLCGHTHGGQVDLPIIGSPFAQSRFGKGHFYGHVEEDNRHMIVSAGLGESIVPIRFMRPPEIVLVTLGASPAAARQAHADAPVRMLV